MTDPEIEPTPDDGAEADSEADSDSGDDGRIGIFPTWRSLYVSVVVYTVALILLLYAFTVLLDFSG